MAAVLASATILAGCADDNSSSNNTNQTQDTNQTATVSYDDSGNTDTSNQDDQQPQVQSVDGDIITYTDGSTCDTSQDDCNVPDVQNDPSLYAGGMYYWGGGMYYPYPVFLYGGHYYRRGTHTIAVGVPASRVPGNAVVRDEPKSRQHPRVARHSRPA